MENETPILIHLDNNFLTHLWNHESIPHKRVLAWKGNGHVVGTSAIAWMEFLCGSDGQQRSKTESDFVRIELLKNEIEPFNAEDAVWGAYFFHLFAKNRQKKVRMDSLIAACAIRTKAQLATEDPDFQAYRRYDLQLADLS